MQHFVTIYAKLFPELNHPTFILLNGALAVQIFFVLSGDALSAAFFATGKRRSIDVLLLKRYPRSTFPILIACLAVYAVNVLGLNFHGQAAPLILRQSWHGAPPDDFGGMIFYSFIRVFLELPTSANVYHPFLWTMRLELIGSLGVFAFDLLPRLPNPVLSVGWCCRIDVLHRAGLCRFPDRGALRLAQAARCIRTFEAEASRANNQLGLSSFSYALNGIFAAVHVSSGAGCVRRCFCRLLILQHALPTFLPE